jgi:hypothetical protein
VPAADPRLDAMVAAARAGGVVARRHFRRGVGVTLKAHRSPVTVADREAEHAIADALARACPDHGILGEELGARGPRPGASSSTRSTAREASSVASITGRCRDSLTSGTALATSGLLHVEALRPLGSAQPGQ